MPKAKDDGTKVCGRCRRTLTVVDFHRVRTNTDGRAAWCKQCRSAYSKVYMPKYNATKRKTKAAARNATSSNMKEN